MEVLSHFRDQIKKPPVTENEQSGCCFSQGEIAVKIGREIGTRTNDSIQTQMQFKT